MNLWPLWGNIFKLEIHEAQTYPNLQDMLVIVFKSFKCLRLGLKEMGLQCYFPRDFQMLVYSILLIKFRF